MFRRIIFLFTFVFIASGVFADSIIHHKISVTVTPNKHFIEAVDQITIPANQVKSIVSFLLNNNLKVTSETPGVTIKLDKGGVKAEDLGMDREDFDPSSDFKQNKYVVTIKNEIK